MLSHNHWPILTGLVITIALISCLPANASERSITVTDFEKGLSGWLVMDQGKAEHKTADATLLSVALSDEPHSGARSLKLSYHPGKGWANAGIDVSRACSRWADAQVDEVALWVKGDGSDKQVRIALQQWCDDLTTPTVFEVPISLQDKTWHQVVIPLAKFQEQNPTKPLRLPSMISLQVNGSGEIGPADLWIDDIEVRRAGKDGARFALGPMDDQIAKLPPRFKAAEDGLLEMGGGAR